MQPRLPAWFYLIVLVSLLVGCQRRDVAPEPTRDASAPAPAATSTVVNPQFLEQYAMSYRFRLGWPRAIAITATDDAVLFLRSGPRSFAQDLFEVDASTGKERRLLSAAELLKGADERLSDQERARRERLRLVARGIARFELSKDGRRVLVPLGDRLFVVERQGGAVKELRGSKGFPIDARFSPDGNKVALVRDGDLYVFDVASARERRLTRRPTPPPGKRQTIENGTSEFVAQEEMGRYHGFWWSPDSRKLVFQETYSAGVELMHIAEPTEPTRAPRSWRYPRPGKPNVKVRLGVVGLAGGAVRWITWDAARYPYLATVRWDKGGPLAILLQNRAQTEESLLAVDPSTGATRSLLLERDPAWINLDQSVPRWLEDGSGFLWSTERGGHYQLELRAPDGRLLRAVTRPDLGYRQLLHVDEAGGFVFVLGGPEPTEAHVYRIALRKPGAAVKLTDGHAVYSGVFGRGQKLWVRSGADLSGKRADTVMRRDGKVVVQLNANAENPSLMPKVELATVGKQKFRAVIIRPRNMRPGTRLPLIVYVYGGPHYAVARADARHYLIQQWLADQGFAVVSIDGRGTPGRGRAWERALKGSFVDVPLADQVAGLAALAARYPELDRRRVGIFGWSYGGYISAMAVLRRPDVYQAAVAGAPVTEWRDYDTHYTERYAGLLADNPQGYERSSALTFADQLRRPLLLVHGTADDNVYFSHTLKLTGALFRAGKKFEFLPLAGLTHMVPDPVVTYRLYERIARFFVAQLAPPATPAR